MHEVERSIDSYQWASKVEVQRLFSGKPDLEITVDARAIKDEPTLSIKQSKINRYRLSFSPCPQESY